jgi:hypothetical protein
LIKAYFLPGTFHDQAQLSTALAASWAMALHSLLCLWTSPLSISIVHGQTSDGQEWDGRLTGGTKVPEKMHDAD